MNLIETKTLRAALERLWLVVPKKGSLPVLENLRWRTTEGHLELTATDLDNRLRLSIPFAARPFQNSLDVLVPAKELYQAVKAEAASNLQVRIHDHKFEIHANNRMLVLSCIEPKNFPQIESDEPNLRGQLLSSALEPALDKALFCVSTEPGRYGIDVIKLEVHNSLFRVVGTDGHRLSVVEGAVRTGANPPFWSLLLRSTASILSRLPVPGECGWVQFSTCGAGQEFNLFVMPDGAELIARRGQGQFPNYENVLPKAPLEAKIVLRREELLEALAKLSPTARKAQNSAVKFEFSKRPAAIKSEGNGAANRIDLEHTRITGKPRDVAFNHQYLTQYVKSLEAETISMTLFPKAFSDVALFDSFRYRHLLMPLRD